MQHGLLTRRRPPRQKGYEMSEDGYLPPGVTHRDVDRASGEVRPCPECDCWTSEAICPRCGAEMED